jgi:hypothetical protein
MTNTAPKPWSFTKGIVFDAEGKGVSIHNHKIGPSVVLAVNAHDDLVAALQSALRQLTAYEAAVSGEDYNDTQINAALAKAEGVT